MASVTSTTSTSAADTFAAINGTSGKKTTATSAASDQQDRFLTLLMTQIKNQDPLNPLDNSQVTTQLAQLNMVGGIDKLNTTLSSLLTGYGDTQAMQAAGMLGKNVLVAGNNLPLSNSQAIGGASLASAADSVKLTIKDANGKVVQTQDLGAKSAGNFYFGWDGKDANGNVLGDGNYTFAIDAGAAGNAVVATPTQVGTVAAVVRGTNGFKLDLGTMGEFSFADVQEIL
jgi:flagellar basal-body rod modification protein FlgD